VSGRGNPRTVGERVTVIVSNSSFFMQTGTVTDLRTTGDRYCNWVQFDNDKRFPPTLFRDDELVDYLPTGTGPEFDEYQERREVERAAAWDAADAGEGVTA
jgi:hypothetical protein